MISLYGCMHSQPSGHFDVISLFLNIDRDENDAVWTDALIEPVVISNKKSSQSTLPAWFWILHHGNDGQLDHLSTTLQNTLGYRDNTDRLDKHIECLLQKEPLTIFYATHA